MLDESDRGKTLSYTVAVNFSPEIKLSQTRGLAFFGRLSKYIDLKNASFQPRWTFDGAASCEGLKGAFGPTGFSVSFNLPPNAQDWHEDRLRFIVSEFYREFSPSAILDCGAIVRRLLKVHGDAREFLAKHVMHLAPPRVNMIERPIHIVGLRLMFPPFEIANEDGSPLSDDQRAQCRDWEADVRIESWLQDPALLWVQVDATWHEPCQWIEGVTDQIVNHLSVASEFVDKNLIPFLKHKDQGEYDGTQD